MCFNFLRNENYGHKIISTNSILCKFLIKVYLESFVFSYQFIIYLESSTKEFFTTWTTHWTTGSSVKLAISGATLSENAPKVLGLLSCSLTFCFSFFSVIATFEVTSCMFVLKRFDCSNSLVLFPFLLRQYAGRDKTKWKLWSHE